MTTDRKIAEAILLLAEEPIPAGLIGEVLEKPKGEVEAMLQGLAEEFEQQDRGWVLRQLTDGWRLFTDPECAPWLERFVKGHVFARLTGPALEVLAIVAYKGPISRTQISEIRGVDSESVVKTLLGRGLIDEQGTGEGPGAPVLFQVSSDFLDRLGIKSIEELPSLASFMPEAEDVEAMEAKLSPGV
jgi:segregation and condensation protein B